jgi:hypothetical protein
VSVHRVKSPVPTISYINTKGWARGRRTVAGTMVLTKLTTDVLASFLQASAFTSDNSRDSNYVKVDQLPPFNISMLFSDEYGHISYQRILGIEFVTSGDVYSIQDMLTEQTRSLRPAAPQNTSRGRAAARPWLSSCSWFLAGPELSSGSNRCDPLGRDCFSSPRPAPSQQTLFLLRSWQWNSPGKKMNGISIEDSLRMICSLLSSAAPISSDASRLRAQGPTLQTPKASRGRASGKPNSRFEPGLTP